MNKYKIIGMLIGFVVMGLGASIGSIIAYWIFKVPFCWTYVIGGGFLGMAYMLIALDEVDEN